MWAAGFVAEVRGLLDRGLRDGLTASRALGYRQVLDFVGLPAFEPAEFRRYTERPTRRASSVPPAVRQLVTDAVADDQRRLGPLLAQLRDARPR